MRKQNIIATALLMVSNLTFAGGLLTNTNQSASFLRNFTQGASIDAASAYYNPAGLAFLPEKGLYFSINVQSAYQTRNIDASFDRYPVTGMNADGSYIGTPFTKYYKGTASAPVIPSFQAAYKMTDDWVVSTSFAIGGGGGKASFNDGLPMFEAAAAAGLYANPQLTAALGGNHAVPGMYEINSYMVGRQYIYNFQAGLSYRATDWLSVYAGARMNYVSGSYEGSLDADMLAAYGGSNVMHLALDCTQSGWGLNPVIGVDAKFSKWNLAAKYEFQTNLNVENDTKINEMNETKDYLGAYKDGVNTPNDIPALLMLAGSYNILPNLRASAEYHYFFDKSAGMADVIVFDTQGNEVTHGKQKELTHGTIEWLGGLEYDVSDKLTISCSYQNTNYGLSDNYQSDTSFACDSYSLGFGAKIKFSEKVSVNIGYMWTNYSDYTKASANYNNTHLSGTDVYSRTNKVFGASVDFRL